jgi:hypothetical protein
VQTGTGPRLVRDYEGSQILFEEEGHLSNSYLITTGKSESRLSL